jgi:macrolide transport system ATP-binding/permease protein
METLLNDIRFGLRMMRKRPGVIALIVITLALGIGVNSATFNLVNAILRRPLPVEKPDELVVLYTQKQKAAGLSSISYPDYVDFRDRNTVFSGLIAYSALPLSLSMGEQSERIWGEIVTGNYFEVLGIKAALGRTLSSEDDKTPGGHPVTVLSYNLWQHRFRGDANIVGKIINLNGITYNVIGVAPKEFHGVFYVGFSPALWVPMMQQKQTLPGSENMLTERDNRWVSVMGRLKPGVSIEQAQVAMGMMAQQLAQEYPKTNENTTLALYQERKSRPEPESAGAISLAANIFLVMVGLVLLIACANVANLLLAHASARSKEISLRLALGATRARLIRQLLTENMMLALLSGLVSLGFALLAGMAIGAVKLPTDIPFELDLSLDRRVLIFTFIVSVVTGVIFGLVPALRLTKMDLIKTLNAEGVRGSSGAQKARLRNLLVIAQVAVSVVVLFAAGLFVRSMQGAHKINPGFEIKDTLLLSIDPSLQGYDEVRGRALYRNILDQIKTLPQVLSVSMVSPLPLDFVSNSADVIIDDSGVPVEGGHTSILRSVVGPHYFETIRTRLVKGRDFAETDTSNSPKVVVINETMAKRFWPEADAIGKRIRVDGPTGAFYEVIGIAQNGKYRTIGENPRPYMYLPFSQNYAAEHMTLLLHTSGNPKNLIGPVRNQIQALDKQLPIFDIKTMEEHMSRSLLSAQMSAAFTSIFGLLALILALTGLYGVIWYSVTLRRREMGIRMALGAQQSDILKLVLKQGLGMALIGMGIGLLGAFGVGQLMSSLLYGVSSMDTVTFAIVTLVFLLCALLASYFPARKATRIEPMITLRAE